MAKLAYHDRDHLVRWFEDLIRAQREPFQVGRTVAVRSAMRLAPNAFHRLISAEDDQTEAYSIALLRVLVTAGALSREDPPLQSRPERMIQSWRMAEDRYQRVMEFLKLPESHASLAAAATIEESIQCCIPPADPYSVAQVLTHFVPAIYDARWDNEVVRLIGEAIRLELDTTSGREPDMGSPLWEGKNPFQLLWLAARDIMPSLPGGAFWIDWYQRALDGRPQNWDLLRDVALIEDWVWEDGGAALDAVIEGLVEQHEGDRAEPAANAAKPVPIERLMQSAIANFRFDEIQNLMRMVPFAEDVRELRDPEVLARFLRDAGDTVRSLRVLQNAIAAEAGHWQGAGWISVYLDAVLTELSNSGDLGRLNVGVIVEYGAILQNGAASKEIGDEFGTLALPLRASLEKLRALTIAYFAHALAREAPLKDIRSDPQTPLTELADDLRQAVAAVRITDPSERVPLAESGVDVLEALITEIDRQVRAEFVAPTEEMRSRLRQEADFLMAKTTLSLVLYADDARKALGVAGKGVDIARKVVAGYGALEALVTLAKRLLRIGD